MTDRHTAQESTGQLDTRPDQRGKLPVLKHRVTQPAWLARAAAVGLSMAAVGFVIVFLFVLETSGELAFITRPLPMQLALTLPYLVVIFTAGTTIGAGLAWRNHYWSRTARIHQTVLALLGIAFSWQLAALGFLPL